MEDLVQLDLHHQQIPAAIHQETSGLLVVEVEVVMVTHLSPVEVEALHLQLILHMLEVDVVHIIQIHQLLVKMVRQIPAAAAALQLLTNNLLHVGQVQVVPVSFLSHIHLN